MLDEERFKQLDQLLNRTGLYTQFLTEQLATIGGDGKDKAGGSGAGSNEGGDDEEEEADEEEEPAAGKKGGKRKAAAKGAAAKRAKKGAAAKGAAAGGKKGAAAGAAGAAALDTAAETKALLPLIKGELRDYQLKGVKWLISLWQNGLNGILADQMGLGKTVQTIGLLSHLRANGINGPFMILGPLSVLPNWVSEVERWCPSMPALLYHGSKQERAELRARHLPTGEMMGQAAVAQGCGWQGLRSSCASRRRRRVGGRSPSPPRVPHSLHTHCRCSHRVRIHTTQHNATPFLHNNLLTSSGVAGPDFPVIVTSFEIAMADIKPLSRYSYKYIVVDEGHRLKNFNCRLLRELKTLDVQNKLLLTGTPLQNNLGELWSLLNYLLPDIFSNLEDFESWFDIASSVKGGDGGEGGDNDAELVAAEQRARVVEKLHALLKPFLLRRIKADVEIALPRKQELLLYAPMTKLQRQLNQQLLDRTLAEELAKVADAEGGNSAAAARGLSNVLMQMRKNCNHPDLITGPFSASTVYPPPEELVEQCGKLALLQRLLDRLKARGHKVLIFSQMTKMLDLLESYLDQRGERACRIDGSIAWQERQANIKDFNADPKTWLFLLSTRAGGLGINLTAADTVIIYDSDWNPTADLQAMDRCHRIGQTRPVLVFRLATANSVEGKMLKRAAEKMALERLVIKQGVFKQVVDQGSGGAGGSGAGGSSMNAAELLELLRADYKGDDVPQSGVVDDATLERLLDRAHLEQERGGGALPYPASGVGYEVVQAVETSGLLSNVE